MNQSNPHTPIPLSIPSASLTVSPENLLITFDRPHRSLSTAIYGGGFRNVRYAMNRKLTAFYERESDFPGGSVKAWLARCASDAGAVPEESAVLLTAAKVNLYSHKVIRSGPVLVEAITTGGVEKTACRASSSPLYREEKGKFAPLGTINMMVLFHGSLPDGIMARVLITLTEGKTAALNDLGIADVNNGKPATGTGTDGITFITDPKGPAFTDAGPFSELGASLAKAAYESVTECIQTFDHPWNASPLLATPKAVDLEELRKKERIEI
ncbi:adenosylcobinamide amidohydrolase [Dialister sp.]|jgi:adenosylcobinamide hydrolase|uniref:adenosylcobinamide amidohydrolase n=1 Tax=Dialister sp. TaxID=1955814 RepID=UPI003A5C3181